MKKATHVFAVALMAIAAFVPSSAGQALIHQYPILSGIAGIVLSLAAVYHQPVANS